MSTLADDAVPILLAVAAVFALTRARGPIDPQQVQKTMDALLRGQSAARPAQTAASAGLREQLAAFARSTHRQVRR